MVKALRPQNNRRLALLWMLAGVTAFSILCMKDARAESADLEPPVLTAAIENEALVIRASDAASGVAGVQVNGLLYTKLDGDVIRISLPDTLGSYEDLAIRAFDFAGNFTEPMHLTNPLYQDEAASARAPTPSPTAAPTSTSTITPKHTPNAPAQTHNLYTENSAVYVSDWTRPTPTAVSAMPTPIIQTVVETEYIPIGPGMPYQSDGNSHTRDVLYSAATNKQFITIQTKNGNTFYLVIDFDKPIDAEAELYETYFLNLVDERDLMELLSEEEKEAVPTPTPQVIYVTPQPTAAPIVTAAPDTQGKDTSSVQSLLPVLLALVGMGGAGAFLFLNKRKGKKQPALNDFDMDDDEEAGA